VDLPGYGVADLEALAGLLALHRKAVRQALSPWERPRLTVSPGHFFTSATVPRLDPAAYRVRAGQLALFVGPNYLVSAHQQPLPFAEHLRARALASPDLVRLDAAFMLYVVLDELFAYYELLNEHLRGEIERMEERALRDTSDRFLEDLTHFKRYVVALAQLAEQHRAIVAAYLRPDFPWVSGADVEDYFEDLDDRLRRLLDTLAGNRETVNGAFEIYVSQTTHRTNALIRVLTMVSTVLFSAAVIAAIFGASIQGLATNQPAVFVLMVACIAATAAATIRAFRRRGWL
jgi:magnesium transporter